MNSNKLKSYLASGIFLTFIGLKDLEHFYLFYDGVALGLGVTALILAGIEYTKNVDEEKKE